jgi:hypothetical protein
LFVKKTVKKTGWEMTLKRKIFQHLLKISLEIINLIFNHGFIFRNVKRFIPIESVFLMYPANQKFADAFTYKKRQVIIKWQPWLCGIIIQDKRIILSFCISAIEKDFLEQENLKFLSELEENFEKLRQTIGAKKKTYAGILPGVLYYKKIITDPTEADVTAAVVAKVVDKIIKEKGLQPDTQIVTLGSEGFVGRKIKEVLAYENVLGIDIKSLNNPAWPKKPCIVLNMATKTALVQNIDNIPDGSIVVNEVYPEPGKKVLESLSEKNCPCYHIAGVKAITIPNFPGAYKGAAPCCSAILSEDIIPVIYELSPHQR